MTLPSGRNPREVMRGFHMRITTMKWLPYTDLITDDQGRIRVRGPMGNILEAVRERYNFTYTAKIPEDRQWGMIFSNGSATGMIGMLTRNESDWAANAFGQTLDRLKVVTLSSEFMVQDLSILAGKTFGFADNYFGMFEAFTSEVWAMLFLMVLVMPVVLVLSQLLERNDSNLNNTSLRQMVSLYGGYLLNLAQNIVWASTPENRLPKGTSGMVLTCFWWLSLMIVMNVFLGTMKASLLVSQDSQRIDSLKDVAARKKAVPYIWRGTAYDKLFQATQMEDYQIVYKRATDHHAIVKGSELYSPERFLNILKGRAVIINEQSSMMYNLGKSCHALKGYPGEIYFAKEPVYTHGLSMCIRKTLDPDIQRLINMNIRVLMEVGIIRRWMLSMMTEYLNCEVAGYKSHQEEPIVVALAVSKIKGIMVIYGIGLSFAVFGLLVELTIHAVKRNKNAKMENDMEELDEKA